MKYFSIAFVSLLFLFVSFRFQHPTSTIQKDVSIESRVDSLLALMTLEEKVGQMNQYNGFWEVTGPAPQDGDAARKYEHLRKGWVGSMLNVTGVENVRTVQRIAVEETRLGIPLIIGYDVIHGFKTLSPIPLAEAASWDMNAIRKSAEMAALEASAAGIHWTFAPMVDVSRDARWGRVMEGAGEDPYLGSRIAFERVKGFQGDDLSQPHTIIATAKHFAGYGFSESGRDYNTVDVGTSTLYNEIFPPFRATLDANVRTFMNSFNVLNGIPATGNSFLQREILKGKWEFDGFVVSDWGSIAEMIPHGVARDGKQAAQIAANAGSDMDMESVLYVEHLVDLVREGKVKESDIDDAVRRILRIKFELGLFEDPYRYCDPERERDIVGSDQIKRASLDMAQKSIVLLKNEGNLLPLPKKGKTIALIGSLAKDKDSPLGSWRAMVEPNSAVSVLEGLNALGENEIRYAEGPVLVEGTPNFAIEVKINTDNRDGLSEAVSMAKEADVVVMVLGENGFQSGEARSRADLGLPGLQQELLEEVYKVNQNIVLVLMNGRPLAIEWAANHIPAIVEAWHLGSESGHAIASVLHGDYNPSGKLPMTFPRNVGQVPIYYNYKNTGRPTNPGNNVVFWSHYIDSPNEPLFPFGYGLSYTSFEYQDLKLSSDRLSKGGEIELSVLVKNTGKLKGKETVQLYIRDMVASISRPVRELKGFQQIELEPGESKLVKFTISEQSLGFYTNFGDWVVEGGQFKLFVGGDSTCDLNADLYFE
ncbi:beta-glucosidase BglX [Algoriphagus sp. CAU 1675]|uniref:beta-glucosidase BglX n=1 Tax=Algoriphagus sp. CAU 1675 TaxID=3032597 RepID=UPI0023DBA196|nr:beta-glucosidase BglX [Algoriphagus sp. CAU 1675]MDF2158141.1 beta-glucosidase BglX [Algoriphagus sp. CAU 1675]